MQELGWWINHLGMLLHLLDVPDKQVDMPFCFICRVKQYGIRLYWDVGLLNEITLKLCSYLVVGFLICQKFLLGLLTDQCMAMQRGSKIVFPNARHQLCM